MKRYSPRTLETKQALLKSVFKMKCARKLEKNRKSFANARRVHSKYETMAKDPLRDDIEKGELCTPDLRELLEFHAKDTECKKLGRLL